MPRKSSRISVPVPDGDDGYALGHGRPLGGYAVLMGVFGASFAGSLACLVRRGHELPPKIGPGDVLMAGIATHKLTRLIAKDKVTSALRAPFTEYQQSSGHGEVEEKARGKGLRRSIGELLTCPFCLGQWVVGAFAVGFVANPRLTRLLAAMWTAQAVSDVAQLGYAAAERRS